MPSKIKDSIADFKINEISRGYYQVTYTSPITGNSWTNQTDDKELIRNILNGKSIVNNLVKLKFICKL